ncbi:zinc finger-containing ubiquitin peptidase 1-like isoform X1 [Cololabis saira]|uniref:zinc finger-containing ubiquitin peptidase 1-like isoform X1 n=1 Tax=Cololabis saira TaxID=129043 RepID=UPI002AD4719B|nr:zinc finger-containing ubiquitin peptidase 1-like isoform X1 [Cololabis saira]XP_061571087.1 zinc finger-containing ubiquitin peptidase 1-like isoform X1 [Cololabis saira]
MLTCEICGEEVLLEQDMKTHLLLSHMEGDHHCPLCSLSGVSYNQLCFHITSAHPEDPFTCTQASNTGEPGGTTRVTGGTVRGAGGTNGGAGGTVRVTGGTVRGAGGTNGGAGGTTGGTGGTNGGAGGTTWGTGGNMGGISRGAGEAVLFDASMVRTDLVPSRQRSSAGVSCSSQEETPLIPAAMTTQDSKGKSKHVKAQPLLPSSSKREKVFSCPMCSLVCSSSFILQEHVELHLQEQHSDEVGETRCDVMRIPSIPHQHHHRKLNKVSTSALGGYCTAEKWSDGEVRRVQDGVTATAYNWRGCWTPDSCSAPVTSHPARSPSGGRRLECPLCSAVFSHSFSLQEHVELHLDPGSGGNGTGSLDGDLQLATRLQQQEESRRQEQARQEEEQSRSLATQLQQQEEARQEREDFHKLQRQFGLDGSGGYRQQMERTMERAVARGVLPPAHFHLHKANMMESLASGVDDGATRTQGVIPALREYYQSQALDCVHVWLAADTDHYSSSGGDKGWGCGYRNFQMLLSSLSNVDPYSTHLQGRAVPCIPQLQTMIEEAWKEGLDPQGASHFNQQLQGTRAWIGATEIYVLLTSLGISARIMDFHKPTGPAGTHPLLFDWVREYFSQSNRSSRLPPRFIQTRLPPLYLQHQGHSRSVVGLEQRKNGVLCLLLFDPGCPPSHSSKLLSSSTVGGALRRLRIFPRSLKHQQYQLVAVESTVLSAEEKQTRILQSRLLSAEKIP